MASNAHVKDGSGGWVGMRNLKFGSFVGTKRWESVWREMEELATSAVEIVKSAATVGPLVARLDQTGRWRYVYDKK